MNTSASLADANVSAHHCDSKEINLYGTPNGLRHIANVVQTVADSDPQNDKGQEACTVISDDSGRIEFTGTDLEIRRMGYAKEELRLFLNGVEQFANRFLRQRRDFISRHLSELYERKVGSFTPHQLAGLDEEEQWFAPTNPNAYDIGDAIAVAYPVVDESPRLVIAGTSSGLQWIAKSLICMADVEYGEYNPNWPENSEHHHSWLDGDNDVMLECGFGLVYGRCDHRKDGSVDWYHECLSNSKERFRQFVAYVRNVA